MFCKYIKNIICLFLAGSIGSIAGAGEFRTILGGENKTTEEGYTLDSTYSHWAFLNPSFHAGRITTGDFSIMPRRDINGRHTLSEKEAKVRMFFKPYVRVRTTARRPANVSGKTDWAISKLKDGVRYERSFARDSYQLKSSMEIKFTAGKASVDCTAVLENIGKRACSVEFSPEFTFLRTDVLPLELTLRRQRVRYENSVRTNFWSNETTVLDSRYVQSYWWRRIAPDAEFSRHANREIIPFTHEKLPPPNLFGFSNLPGETTIVWDMEKTSHRIAELDVSWDAGHADATPTWAMLIEPGEKKEISFRILTVKGLHHFDDVGDNWVFGYNTVGDLLSILAAPLRQQDRLSITATVNDSSSGQVVINQRSEVAAMSPFAPGQLDLRASGDFKTNVSYPVRLLLSSLKDNSKILEVSGNIVP